MKNFSRFIVGGLCVCCCITEASAHSHLGCEPIVSDWAAEEVRQAAELGLIPGDWSYGERQDYREPIPRTYFRQLAMQFVAVQNHCDDAALNALVARYLAEKDERGEVIDPFVDGYLYDKYAYYLEVVKGRGNGIFDPWGSITREEAAAMLLRAYQVCDKTAVPTIGDEIFSDMDVVSDWAKDSVETMAAWGIMQGLETGDFAPDMTYTIEQCIITFLRLHQKFSEEKPSDFHPMFSYEQCIAIADANAESGAEIYRLEGPVATLSQTRPAQAAMGATYSFSLYYKDGGIKSVDLGLCSYTGIGRLNTGTEIGDFQFSQDGKTLSCTVELDQPIHTGIGTDSMALAHEAGIYHLSIDVETGSAQAVKQ